MFTEDLTVFFEHAGGFQSSHLIGTTAVDCIVTEQITARSEVDGSFLQIFDVVFKKTAITTPVPKQAISFDGVRHTIDAVVDDGVVVTMTISRVVS